MISVLIANGSFVIEKSISLGSVFETEYGKIPQILKFCSQFHMIIGVKPAVEYNNECRRTKRSFFFKIKASFKKVNPVEIKRKCHGYVLILMSKTIALRQAPVQGSMLTVIVL